MSSRIGNFSALPGFLSDAFQSVKACFGEMVCCPGRSIDGRLMSKLGSEGRPGRLKPQSMLGNRSSRLMLGSQTSGNLMMMDLWGSIKADRMPLSEMMLDQPRSVELVSCQTNSLPGPIQCTSGHSTLMVGKKPLIVPRLTLNPAPLRSRVWVTLVSTSGVKAVGQAIVLVPPAAQVQVLAPMVQVICGNLTCNTGRNAGSVPVTVSVASKVGAISPLRRSDSHMSCQPALTLSMTVRPATPTFALMSIGVRST